MFQNDLNECEKRLPYWSNQTSRMQLIPFFLDSLPALRRRVRQIIQPGFEVDAFDEMFEMSAWLGQRYHYFDEISRGLGNIIIILMQIIEFSEQSPVCIKMMIMLPKPLEISSK
jgi:hypothetical protein